MKALLVLVICTLTIQAMHGQELSDLKWEKRILIISAPPSKQAMLDEQLKELRANMEGINERKLLILHYGLDTLTAPLEVETDKYANHEVPDAFVNPAGFQIVLIGLDGMEKERYLRPVTCDVLFKKIDSMPMRKREIVD